MQTKFWQGTNFWIALGMAAGSIWGLTSEDITPIVSGVFGITGGLFAVREKIKSAAVNWVEWISSPNTWNYVVAAIAAIVPVIPAGLGPKISELVSALIGKNWPSAITALHSIFSMLYFIIMGGAKKKTTPEPAPGTAR
jgi:hypothetical protein